MKLFKALFFAVIACIILFGFVLPALISNRSDASVVAGFAIIATLIYYTVSTVVSYFKGEL